MKRTVAVEPYQIIVNVLKSSFYIGMGVRDEKKELERDEDENEILEDEDDNVDDDDGLDIDEEVTAKGYQRIVFFFFIICF